MRKLFYTLLALIPGVLNAQSPEKHIPSQAGFVLRFDLNSLSKKINFNDLGNYSFLKSSDKSGSIDPYKALRELFRLPDKAAINKTGKLYIFPENHDSVNTLNYLFSVTSSKTFEDRMVDILKTQKDKPSFKKQGKIRVLNFDHRMSISTGKDYVLISVWNSEYYYPDDYYEYNEAKNRVISQIDSIRYANAPASEAAPEEETPQVTEEPVTDLPPSEQATDSIMAKDEEWPDAEIAAPANELMEGDTLVEVSPDTLAAVDYVVAEESYYSNYDNDSLMKQFERKWAIKRKQKEDAFWERRDRKMTASQKRINELTPEKSIYTLKDYSTVFQKQGDFLYWFNYSSYSSLLLKQVEDKNPYRYVYDTAYTNMLERNRPPNTLAAMIEGNSVYGIGNFNKGELSMNFYSGFNDVIRPYIEKAYLGSVNPNFFKYVKSDNLMGMMAMSVNMEAVADLYYEIFRRAMESTAAPNRYLVAALEFTDIFLDKKVLYHTFRGDGLVAVTGMRSYVKNYTTYEFDSATFESRYVEKSGVSYLPEFMAVMTIENKDNLNRILGMVTRLGGMVMISDGIYQFTTGKKQVDSSFYLVISNDLCFITNDRTLALENARSGLPVQNAVGNTYKDWQTYPGFGVWDASKMLRLMSETTEGSSKNSSLLLKWSEKLNKGYFVSKPLNGNIADTEIKIEMKNKEHSSLLEILDLFEELYTMGK